MNSRLNLTSHLAFFSTQSTNHITFHWKPPVINNILPSSTFHSYKSLLLVNSSNPQMKEKEQKMGFFDLEKHFALYGAYHKNPFNVLLHMIFVWPILFTALILLYFTPPLFKQYSSIEFGDQSFLILNYGFLFTVVYALSYVGLDKKAGSFAAFMCFLSWVGSSALASRLGFSLAWKVVLASQVISWIGVSMGHAVFEKRAPAFFGNLTQTFLLEPFCLLLEVLQYAFGYEPYPGFYAGVKVKIDKDLKGEKEKKVY